MFTVSVMVNYETVTKKIKIKNNYCKNLKTSSEKLQLRKSEKILIRFIPFSPLFHSKQAAMLFNGTDKALEFRVGNSEV